MTETQALILVVVIAFVVAGAGFSVALPRRFTDQDADGEPDETPSEAARACERDRAKGREYERPRADLRPGNKKAAPKGG